MNYDCNTLKLAEDELTTTNVYTPHEYDKQLQKIITEDDSIILMKEIKLILDAMDTNSNLEKRDIHPTRRSLSIIANRHTIIEKISYLLISLQINHKLI